MGVSFDLFLCFRFIYCVFMCTMCVPGAYESQEMALDLETAVRHGCEVK